MQDEPQDIGLRELTAMSELRPIEAIQRTVWGIEDIEVVPASAMCAAVHAGGLVVGAFAGAELVGFTFGLMAAPHGTGMAGPGMHSHMAAVLPGRRSQGIGRALKRFQADWCESRGKSWISWTFDPLRRENANFNLAVLSARCYDYLPDFYGPMPGRLGGGIASDRLLAVWHLGDAGTSSPHVARRASALGQRSGSSTESRPDSHPTSRPVAQDDLWLLPLGIEPSPIDVDASHLRDIGRAGVRLLVGTPGPDDDVFSKPDLAVRWRQAQRTTFTNAISAGFAVTGFVDGAYVLTRLPQSEDDGEARPTVVGTKRL